MKNDPSTLSRKKLTRLKLDLLCNGVKTDEKVKQGLIPRYRYKRASLSEGRNFLITYEEGQSTVVNLAVYEKFTETSPYEYDHSAKILLNNGSPVCTMELVEDPEWYLNQLDDGTLFASYIQMHGTSVLASSLTNHCSFKDDRQGCAFCGLTTEEGQVTKNPVTLAKVLHSLETVYPGKYDELNLNSGTPPSEDMGAKTFLAALKEVRKVSAIPLSAQIAPMSDSKWIDKLKCSGLSSLSFNLEIWDDQLREKIMPGKGRIGKDLYLDCLEYAGKVFGGANVSSWLIAGLEPPRSTIRGAEEVARRGVLPFVTVFRPITGSPLEDRTPPDVETMSFIYSELKHILEKYELNPRDGVSGCAKCDCCAAGGELLAYGL